MCNSENDYILFTENYRSKIEVTLSVEGQIFNNELYYSRYGSFGEANPSEYVNEPMYYLWERSFKINGSYVTTDPNFPGDSNRKLYIHMGDTAQGLRIVVDANSYNPYAMWYTLFDRKFILTPV